MSNIEVEKIIEPVATSDGAGVKLKEALELTLLITMIPF